MDVIHYLTGYDRATDALRREHRIPGRAVGAVRDILNMQNLDHVIPVPADLVSIVGYAIDVMIPLHECDSLDWFVDTYSRE